MNMAITHQGKTDVGRMRQNNEDAFYPNPKDGTVDPSGVARAGHLFIVADGVGGNRGGARASQIAVTRLPAVYYSATNGDPAHGLRVAFNGVAHEVVAEAATNPERANMSCTVVAAVVKDGAATIAHLGDARAYLLRGGALQPLTTDHTWVQMQVEKGTLSAAEAENHPDRNVITKSMGNPAFPEPTVRQIALQEGDRLLLCSDGLCGLVSDAEMAAVLNRAPDPGAAVGPLIDLANRKGGTDNITALVIQAGRPATAAAPRRSNAGLWVGLFALVVMLGAALFLWRPGGGAAGGTPVAEAAATAEPGTTVAALAGGDETAVPGEATSTLAAGGTVTGTVAAAALPGTAAATAAPTVAAIAAVRPALLSPGAPCSPGNPGPVLSVPPDGSVQFVWNHQGELPSGSQWVFSYGTGSGLNPPPTGTTQQQSGTNWLVTLNGRDLAAAGNYTWQVYYLLNGRPISSDAWCFRIEAAAPTNAPPPPTERPERPTDEPEPATPEPPTAEPPTTEPPTAEPPTKTPSVGD